jgi:hypothetical protein
MGIIPKLEDEPQTVFLGEEAIQQFIEAIQAETTRFQNEQNTDIK